MPELAISDSCIHCGGCVAICPWQVIELTDGRVPRYQDGGAERCILCGHCEAVCLTGALLLDDPRLTPTGRNRQDVHWLMLGYPAIRYQRPPKRQPADIRWR